MSAVHERLRDSKSSRRGLAAASYRRLLPAEGRQQARRPRPKLRVRLRVPFAVNTRRGAVLVAAMLGGTGAFFIWQALLVEVGTIALPGPGFFPLLLGALMITGAVGLSVQSWFFMQGEMIEIGHRDVLITASTLLGVPFLFERLGAYVSFAMLAIAMLVLIGRVAPGIAVIATAIGLAGCWLFFQIMLGLQLPSGPL
jgi:hypothetical protein